ncbi:hypothetical protein GH714_021704 [Hevea brasiliensis]|uniref:Subtilisin-like protease n=1 Tax=Hevea brasiliensis TaxID=3981 RepID=A0A6A6KWJ0_HEVBR|nr:hypothetical protein GH714_021704 [Hevea brasiliensis]
MRSSKISAVLLFFVLCLFQTPALAIKKSYIVYLGSHAHGAQVSEADLHAVTQSHHEFLGSFLGSTEKARDAIFYSYKHHINGFAAVLEEEEAAQIAKHPEVVSVFPNAGRKLHTTHSWEFMSLEMNSGVIHRGSLWNKANFGEDTIIANLDTGVWPESESFNDKGYGPIPSRWKGICQNDTVPCNRKLIGSRFFNDGYRASGGIVDPSYNSPLDSEGHGTHTLSTTGGNFVHGANVFGNANGTTKGGSPRARVAAYKVCWHPVNGSQCYDSDIMAGFDAAINDGVDVISVSLGGVPSDYYNDGIAIGAFHAIQKGIVVVCSAGNDGPFAGTVTNIAPWMITVGASTMDREFQTLVELGNGQLLKGTSLAKAMPENKFYPLITGVQAKASNASADDAELCEPGSLDPEKVKGKILACLRGDNARADKGMQAYLAGAAGMILCNDKSSGNEIISDTHILPASHINYADGLAVFSYVNSSNAIDGHNSCSFLASFSSVGPNTITPQILKPDITAPGVNVIAAYTEATSPTGLELDKRRTPFISMSGTSMSCPHVSGVVGLLKTLHPDWSPAAIRSAISTTAKTRDNTVNPMLDGSFVEATPFKYGSGHIRPNRAMDPGLVYDLSVKDYLDFFCSQGYNETMIKLISGSPYKCPKSARVEDFNYHSISLSKLRGTETVNRKLKNVGKPGTYAVRIREPYGISVNVEPKILKFDKIGEEKTFKVTFKAKWAGAAASSHQFGALIWSDGYHYVRSPITVEA